MPYALDYDARFKSTKRQSVRPQSPMAKRRELEDSAGSLLINDNSSKEKHAHVDPSSLSQPADSMPEIRTSDRNQLIKNIKRGQRTTWIPKPSLQVLCDEDNLTRKTEVVPAVRNAGKQDASHMFDDPFFGQWMESRRPAQSIPSAYHSGDFNESSQSIPDSNHPFLGESPTSVLSTTPPLWPAGVPDWNIGRAISIPSTPNLSSAPAYGRKRAPSLGSSLSSSFIMRTPTSPLVHAISHTYLEGSADSVVQESTTGDSRARRRTLPPNSYQSFPISLIDYTPPNFSRPFIGSRTQSSVPYRTHQTRRSLSSFTFSGGNIPYAPVPRERRPSLALDASPRHRLSMIGSFEESILRGRMSSPASKPFEFIAQIGVVGKGDCAANLKCPAHVSVSFNAVYYHYPASSQSRSISDDAPSPYVGTIDFEHNLKPIQLSVRRRRNTASESASSTCCEDPRAPENTSIGKALARDQRHQRQRSRSPKVLLGGAYRVPQKGQIQILIKNENKTAVKLFLVPYDLEEMTPGTKTFVRQRSYSYGPIVETALGSTDRQPGLNDPLKDKPILRYLIHLKFCCPAKNRFYLYDNARVVFANRVPDGKENIRNDIQLPDPRYSTLRSCTPAKGSDKPSELDVPPISIRQQTPLDIFNHLQTPGFRSAGTTPVGTQPFSTLSPDSSSTAIDFFRMSPDTLDSPTRLTIQQQEEKFPASDVEEHLPIHDTPSRRTRSPVTDRTLSPIQGFFPSTSTRSSPVPWVTNSIATTRSFSPAPVEAGDGLLSRQFKSLGGQSLSSSPSPKVESEVPLQRSPRSTSPLVSRVKSPQGVGIADHMQDGSYFASTVTKESSP